MISKTLQKFIPSGSYVEYLNETGYVFTDFEEAGILWHVIEDQELKMEELLKLAGRTEDVRLKEQIEAKVGYEKKTLAMFMDNSAADAIYVVEYVDEEEPDFYTPVAGFAADFETAYAIGMRTESRFTISKRALYSSAGEISERHSDKTYLNPYMDHVKGWDISGVSEEELRERYEVDAIGYDERVVDYSFGELHFNSRGWLEYYCTKDFEDESVADVLEREFSGKVFYNSFIELPFPFEKGDFVRLVDNKEEEPAGGIRCLIGIVDTSREDYEDFLRRAGDMHVEAGDASVTVQFMYEDGAFMHDHIMPLFLEKAEADRDADWYDLAMNARWMILGEGSLDFFTYAYEKRRNRYRG